MRTGDKMNENYKGIASLNSLLRTQITEYLKKELRSAGNNELSPSHGLLLWMVYKHNGKVQIKTVYDYSLKQKSTITEMIKRLVTLGYLDKVTCADDMRITYIVATEKTIAFKSTFDIISDKLITKFFQGFSELERSIFTELMMKAIRNF